MCQIVEVIQEKVFNERETQTPSKTIKLLEWTIASFIRSKKCQAEKCLVGSFVARQVALENMQLTSGLIVCTLGSGIPVIHSSELNKRGVKVIGQTKGKKKTRQKKANDCGDRLNK